MLTLPDYNSLWANDFAAHATLPKPSFRDYQLSERMLEDYLDIFRGVNTRVNGHVRLPYPHPFFDENGKPLLQNKPNIKYIMIAEARPEPRAPIWNNCFPFAGDEANTFFYNIQHIKNTAYLNAPQVAFGCPNYKPCPSDKIKTLLCLAKEGVLLLDLFPFAIKYSTKLRKILHSSNTVRFYWDGVSNPYSIKNRIKYISNLLCKDQVKLAFIAPPITSHTIAEGINNFHWPTFGLIPRLGINTIIPTVIIAGPSHSMFILRIPSHSSLNGVHPIIYPLPLSSNGYCMQVPTYACCSYDASCINPNELFIRNAFGI